VFCTDYYGGGWSFAGVDRLAIRGWLGNIQQRGLAKRSAARALSALRTFYRFLNTTRGLGLNPPKAARTPRLERTLPEHLARAEIEQLFAEAERRDRKSTRLNSSHVAISYAVFCLKKKKNE